MKCPKCETELQITDRNNIEIDHCPTCRGVWLDRGELDKLIDASSRPSDRDYEDDESEYSDGRGGKRRERENFLTEIFDFF
jgi:Zn-finger nucleic acid-binding protein